MRIKRIIAFFAVVSMLLYLPNQFVKADTANTDYEYFMSTDKDSAYALFGRKIEQKYCTFIDGLAQGINDPDDPLYSENVVLDGLESRKYYNKNSVYLKIDSEFFEENDHEFLFSIVFYDFGPSEGTFYFEYHSTDGTVKQVKLIKPGKNPGWSVKTVCADDIDLTKLYENGATVRIVNGAYNAFKKIEIINVSKLRREKKVSEITCLGNEKRATLQQLRIISESDVRFLNKNLAEACTVYDSEYFKYILSGKNVKDIPNECRNIKITQGELLKSYMNMLGIISNNVDDIYAYAKSIKFIESADFFMYDSAEANYYNLISVISEALSYKDNLGKTQLSKMIENGYYDDIDVSQIKNDAFIDAYYSHPKKNEYKTITDNETKRSYKFIDFFGGTLLRPYLTMQSWTQDGKKFLCGTESGYIFLYDTESQMMIFLDKAQPHKHHINAMVADNGWIYYSKSEGGYSLWRIHPQTLEKEMLYEFPKGVSFTYMNITNDGRYASFEISDPNYVYERPKDTYPIVRLCLETKEVVHRYYSFDFSNWAAHYQINPVYPNLIFFAHETDTSKYVYANTYDRVNIMDIDTGNVVTFNQGQYSNGNAVQMATHETWSADGEYLYFCSWATDRGEYSGNLPAVIRINKDGTHRQYYYNTSPESGFNHCFINGDGTFAAVDQHYLSLLSTQTNQLFPIVNHDVYIGTLSHPYHPHPHIAKNKHIMNWGQINNTILGIAWYDFTHIVENEVAKGGRFAINDMVSRVSYENIDCESAEVLYKGENCIYAKPGKELYLDINEAIVDTSDGAVEITFDYLDNGSAPIVLTYTKGVKEQNDAWKIFNKKQIIKRLDSKKWKNARIVIDSGNFENIGDYSTDFKIGGLYSGIYIKNIKIERLD